MNRDILKLLEYEAKRRPEIQKLVDKVDDLSDDDIAKADVPMPWFRQALTKLRDHRKFEKASQDFEDGPEVDGENAAAGTIYEYTGVTMFVSLQSKLETELVSGDLFFMTESGNLWLNSQLWEQHIPEAFVNRRKIKDGTRQDYIHFLQASLEKKAGLIPDRQTPTSNRFPAGVTIRRLS